MKKRFRKIFAAMLMLGISILFAGFLGELFFRWALFSSGDSFAGLKQAEDFAHPLSPEYWKLRYHFGQDSDFPPPKEPLPELGWGHVFFRGCYMHKELFKKDYNKRPVLLYGDSFAMTVNAAESFQDILNVDTTFNKEHYFLNYGIGGYGVGQIMMLMERTAHKFHRPFVVFSLLTTDMDRTILPWRTGQKPQFDVDEAADSLVIRNLPIDSVPEHWMEENGPGITSYLFRRFLYSKLNFLPHIINGRSRANEYYSNHIKRTNAKVLKRAVNHLNGLDLDYVVMVFHHREDILKSEGEVDPDWREKFIKEQLEKLDVPYIWTRDLILADHKKTGKGYRDYILEHDGHPTTYYNQLVCEEIKKRISQSRYTDSWEADTITKGLYSQGIWRNEKNIRMDSAWVKQIRAKADTNGTPLDQAIRGDAAWILKGKLIKDLGLVSPQ